MLKFIFSLYFLICTSCIYGQGIKGRVIDNANKTPLPFATVTIYNAIDTTLASFKVTDANGEFRFNNLTPQRALRMLITSTGYGVFRKEFTLKDKNDLQDFGEIGMDISLISLQEVVVTAEIPPLVVRKDTLEFNAASFKTLPSALVEDLLQKLPGVQIDVSGNIFVNGKMVNKILVDGREFFGSDYKVATRNLPADIINKVQVTHDKEVIIQNPDLPESRIPQIINLTLKKGIKKGVFGKIYAGGGVSNKYESGGIINLFRDTTQVSVLAYTNNLNKAGFGFEDINRIGGFNRSGYDMFTSYGDGGLAFDDLSFGGTGQGRQKSAGAGFNFNTITRKKIQINAQYFFGNINSNIGQLVNTSQSTAAGPFYTNAIQDQRDNNFVHRMGGKLNWKFDSLTTFELRPSLSFRSSENKLTGNLNTYNNLTNLSQSINQQQYFTHSTSLGTTLLLTKLFKKPGRRITLNGDYLTNSDDVDRENNAFNSFQGLPSTELKQLRNNDRSNYFLRNTLTFIEKFNARFSGTLRYYHDSFKYEDFLRTYEYDPLSQTYAIIVDNLSENLTRIGFRSRLNASLRYVYKGLTIIPGLQLSSIHINNTYLRYDDIKQNFTYFNPTLFMSYKDLEFSYTSRLQEPDPSDLQPVTDNSNPLYLIVGNPRLRPTFVHAFSSYLGKYISKYSVNYSVSLSATIENNSIVRDRSISPAGIQTLRSVNVDGVRLWGLYYSVFKTFNFDNNKISVGHAFSSNYKKNVFLLNSQTTRVNIVDLNPSVQLRANLKDLFELHQTFGYGLQKGKYDSGVLENLDFTRYDSKTDFLLRYPKNLVWESSIIFRYNSNIPASFQRYSSRLNGGVTYIFGKNRAQVKLTVYDILNQNINIMRLIRENYIEDKQTTVLNRYGILTFTYNIRDFGLKPGGLNSILRLF